VRLDIEIGKKYLEFRLSNNRPENINTSLGKKGIGLANVKKRLQLLYPDTHSLIITETDMSFDVFMKVALHSPGEVNGINTMYHESEAVQLV
jgi:two-component system, LytTR family, sensor kinase